MENLIRKQYIGLWEELVKEKSLIFLAGPRQAGKTTLAKHISSSFVNHTYFNWDIISDKKKIIEDPVFFQGINRLDDSNPLVVFDEIHKYKDWKNYLKGIFDEFHQEYYFLVSGSGRLDLYKSGGESLAGRYLMFHLFPFTVSELSHNKRSWKEFVRDPLQGFKINKPDATAAIWSRLSELSGFPEPYLKQKRSFWVQWSANYHKQIIREDIRDMSGIKKINELEILYSLLPSKIGSPLSINSLAGDVGAAFDSVKNWISLFERAYLLFRISPWNKRITRAIKKEQKAYIFDHPLVTDPGSRFENMVAVELYRSVARWNEKGLGIFSLHYIRNKEKQEVDFLICDNNKPWLMIEAKNGSELYSQSLQLFQSKLNIPAVQLVNREKIYKIKRNGDNRTLMTTAHEWLSSLP